MKWSAAFLPLSSFLTTRAAHAGVLLATACHSATLRVVSEHQKCE